MALTANTLPFNAPSQDAPFDASTCFNTNATWETKTSTGYFGAPTTIDIGPGHTRGYWVLLFNTRVISGTDESYTFYLLGSNDSNWGNGNVEILQAQNFGYVRSIATIPGVSPAMPTVGPTGELDAFQFSNLKSGIVYRYLRTYLVVAGASPSTKVLTWLTYNVNLH